MNKAHVFQPHSSHGSPEPCRSTVQYMEGDVKVIGKRVLGHSPHYSQVHAGDSTRGQLGHSAVRAGPLAALLTVMILSLVGQKVHVVFFIRWL